MSTSTDTNKKAVKPCPRCGSAAGKGNGGSQCQCKKIKAAKATTPAPAPAPCDAPIGKQAVPGSKSGDCGCGKK